MKKTIVAAFLLLALAAPAQSFTCAEVRAAYGQYCRGQSISACIRWARSQGYSWADVKKALACLRRGA
jgi:hypothetical protein